MVPLFQFQTFENHFYLNHYFKMFSISEFVSISVINNASYILERLLVMLLNKENKLCKVTRNSYF